VTLRATQQCRPTLILGAELSVTGDADSAFALDGLLVAGAALRVPNAVGNELARLRITDATLVPGLTLDAAGQPGSPDAPSLVVELPNTAVELQRAIVGGLRVADAASLAAANSIIDATAPTEVAYTAPDGTSPGGELSLDACTVIGKIAAESVGVISNSLILARALPADTLPPVYSVRRQVGCVRFTFLPFASLVPRRHACQPQDEEGSTAIAPRFTSLRYGNPAYCQLTPGTPDEVRRGADDESEMGAFHALFPAQREANLRTRLNEFLRVGLSAGIFDAS
jgi:hypothetical protein